ncbi:MAG TPA: hypothetical protein VD996_12140 [Chitinophagaceae bacterium]|nr:hypothetical protein [Chitinophagaceae bacterium]
MNQHKKNYDSGFCGSLPLHLINLIQPYGVRVALHASDLSIVQAGRNAAEVPSMEHERNVTRRLQENQIDIIFQSAWRNEVHGHFISDFYGEESNDRQRKS